MPDVSVAVDRQGTVAVVAVTGEIDLATEPTVWSHVQQAMADGATRLVLDLAGTSFMDSTGLSLVIRATRLYGSDAVEVHAPQPRLRQLFSITGVDKHVTIGPPEAPAPVPASEPPDEAEPSG